MTGARLVQRKGRVDWVQTCATPVQRKGGLIAVKSRISGKEAVYVARESERRRPVKLLVSRSVHASTINAWHLRPIWRATEHAYVKPSANSCRMSSSTFAERCLACG